MGIFRIDHIVFLNILSTLKFYLVRISETVREVSVLKKKMQYDPVNAPIYEEQIWVLYTEVTRLKDKYYKTKGI